MSFLSQKWLILCTRTVQLLAPTQFFEDSAPAEPLPPSRSQNMSKVVVVISYPYEKDMKLGKPMKACYFDSFAAPPRISFKSSHIPKSSHILSSDLPLAKSKPAIQPVVFLTLSHLPLHLTQITF